MIKEIKNNVLFVKQNMFTSRLEIIDPDWFLPAWGSKPLQQVIKQSDWLMG